MQKNHIIYIDTMWFIFSCTLFFFNEKIQFSCYSKELNKKKVLHPTLLQEIEVVLSQTSTESNNIT